MSMTYCLLDCYWIGPQVATLLFSPDDARERQQVRVVTLDSVVEAAEGAYPGLPTH